MKELLPRSSAHVGLTRFCFLLLCGSGQRPSWLFESVTSHFAFIRSSFTLSMWLNTFACSVSHMTSLVLVLSCQGSHLALVRRRGTHSFRGCLSTVCPSGSCLLGTGTLYCCQGGFASVLSHFLHFQRFAQCGAVYIVQVATVCTGAQVRAWAGACARVARLTGGFLGRSGRV